MTTTETNAITVTRHLPVKLDQYRKNVLADNLAKVRLEENRLAEHMKTVQESVKAMIKEQQKHQNISAHAIAQGYEMHEISCEQKIEGDHMVTYRLDNGEQVDERALTADEIKHATKKTMVLKP